MARSRASEGLFARRARRQKQRSRLGLQVLEDRALMATFNISSTTDSTSSGSLRDAITQAYNNGAGTDTINLAAGTYVLSVVGGGTSDDANARGDLDVRGSGDTVTIQGAGAGVTIIDANAIDRIFHIQSGVTFILKDVTLTGGDPLGSSQYGAALRGASATITLENVIITGNSGDHGGGIGVVGTALTLTNVTITDNDAFDGGGLYVSGGSLTMTNSEVSDNVSDRMGGGVYLFNTTASITNSLVTENEVLGNYNGGGIYSDDAALTLTNTNLTLNTIAGAGDGGGMYVTGGTFGITGGSISQNVLGTAGSSGGGLYIFLTSNATISGAVIDNNAAYTSGGGILLNGTSTAKTLTIVETSISGNTATGGSGSSGGGIYSSGGRALVLDRSTVANNSTRSAGGGIFHTGSASATVTITNSTISGNTVTNSGGDGGGLVGSASGTTPWTFLNVTIVNNTADDGGGGVNVSGTITVYAKNSIFANNTAAFGPDFKGKLESQGYNLIESTSGATITGTTTGNVTGTDPNLSALGSYGGPTQTHRPNASSPLIDAGTNTGAPAVDQRGVSRPQNGTVDIGAVESDFPIITVTQSSSSANEDAYPGTTLTFTRVAPSIASPLTIPITFAGTATHAYDYYLRDAFSLTQITFPAGEDEVTITLVPVDDYLDEANETVLVSIVAGAGYLVGAAGSVTFTILDNESFGSSHDVSNTKSGPCCYALPVGSAQALVTRSVSEVDQATGLLSAAAGLSDLTGKLAYNQAWDARPIIAQDVTFASPATTATSIEVQLTFGGLTQSSVYYDPASITVGVPMRLAIEVDASALASGRYGWSMAVIEHYSGSGDVAQNFTGAQDIRTSYSAAYGALWAPVFVDRLIVSGSGALWEQGRGNSYWFPDSGGSTYARSFGEPGFSTLVYSGGSSTYTLTSKHGDALVFDAAGRLLTRIDTFGNETAYTYTDGDGDTEDDEVATITDPTGRVTTWTYAGNKLASITDIAARATSFTITGGKLLTVTSPDPDGGGGPLSSPVMAFGYDGGTGLLTSITNAESEAATITYHTDRTVDEIEFPDLSTESYNVPLRQALVIPGASLGSSGNPADLVEVSNAHGTFVGRSGEDFIYDLNDTGSTCGIPDPLSNTFETIRNHEGDVVAVISDDPDGAGPLGVMFTYLHFNAMGDLMVQHNPDNSRREWTYDATWHVPTSFTDELGHTTVYTIGETTGAVLEVRQVVGEIDDGINLETDDVVTTYTYTEADADDLPDGMLLLIETELGRTTKFEYYRNSGLQNFARLYYQTEAYGTADEGTRYFAWDAAGNMIDLWDELMRHTVYTYDNLDRLTSATLPDPDGIGTVYGAPAYSYLYDQAGRLTKQTDPLLRETEYIYNAQGQLDQIVTPDHDANAALTVTEFNYDGAGRLEEIIDANGGSHTFVYNEQNRVIERHGPSPDGIAAGPVYKTSYGPSGLVLSTTDPLDNVTNYVYENFGRRITTKQPHATTGVENTGPQSSFEYDSLGNLVRATDPLSRATTYAYDALNRLSSVTAPDPDGPGGASAPVTQYGYNKRGETTSVTDPLGHVTAYTRDYRGRVTKATLPDPDGVGGLAAPEEEYEYDAAGQLIGFTDAMDHETTYELDDLGRVVEVTSPDPDGYGYGAYGSEWDYEFDAVGRLVSLSDLLGNKTEYEYDAHDNLITTIDANLQETTSTFDDLGNMLSLTDPESNTTAWVYDGLNRVTTETNELNDDRLFDYDIAGNLSEKTDRNGRVTQYAHDHLNRLTAELWKSGGSTIRTLTYTYDAAGQLSYAGDAAAEYDFIYDGLGRATSITADLAGLTPDVIFAQAFDARGNRSSLSATINTTLDFLNSYTYDNLDRLTQVTQAGQGGGNTVAQKRVNFTYNALSQFSTIVRYANTAGTQHVATTTFGYDAANRLTDLDHARGGTALAGYDFGYDEANRLTSLANTQYSAESATFTYDAFGQLTAADRSGGGNDEAYNYDDNGNRETANGATYTVGPNNQIESDGTYDYEYDAEGNRTAKETIATGAREEYDWDYRNRLTKITFRNGGGTVVKVVEQSYDIFNHWIRRNVDPDGPGGSAATDTFFLYDGNQIALEFDAAAATDVSHRYLWGPAVDQILADEAVASVGSAGDILWPLTDHLNTVRDLATFDPAAGGGAGATTIANHIAYESFGKVKSETNSAVDHFFGFTGRPFDASTNLQDNWKRPYDAGTGTWMSEDPIGFKSTDTNLFRYVANAPTSHTDPTGTTIYRVTFYWSFVAPDGTYAATYTTKHMVGPAGLAGNPAAAPASWLGKDGSVIKIEDLASVMGSAAASLNGDPQAEKEFALLLDRIENASIFPWAIPVLGRFWPDTWGNVCYRWTHEVTDHLHTLPAADFGLKIHLRSIRLRWPGSGGPEHSVTIFKLRGSDKVFAFDQGALGGADHLFDPDDIIQNPPPGVPEETIADLEQAVNILKAAP